jgi:YVTN family beta-propeller protein
MRRLALVLLVLAAAAAGQRIRWQATVVGSPPAPTGRSWLAPCSATGRVYISDDESEGVRILDDEGFVFTGALATPSAVRELFHHDPTCRLYCASSEDDGLYVLDCRTGNPLATVELDGAVSAWAYSPVENKLYLLVDEQSVQAVDLASDSVIATLDVANAGEEDRRSLCYAANENVLFCVDGLNGVVAAVDCRADTVLGVVELGGEPCALAYNPANSRVYCARSGDDTLFVIDAASRQVVARVAGGCPGWVKMIEVNSAYDRVYCSGWTVVVIDGTSNAIRGTVELPGIHGVLNPELLKYDSVNARLYATCLECMCGAPLGVIDGRTDSACSSGGGPGVPNDACLGPRQESFWISSENGGAGVYDAVTGARQTWFGEDYYIVDIAVSPGTRRFAVSSNWPSRVYLLDAGTGARVTARSLGDDGGEQLVFVGGGRLAVLYEGLTVLSEDGLNVVGRLPVGRGPICYDTLAGRVYVAGAKLHVLDSTAGRMLDSLEIPDDHEGPLVPACGGRRLVALGSHSVHIIDVEQMRLVETYRNSMGAASFCVDASGHRGYYLLRLTPAVCVLDLERGLVLDTIPLCSPATQMAYDPLTDRLYCFGRNSPIVEVLGVGGTGDHWFTALPSAPLAAWSVRPGVLLFSAYRAVVQYDCRDDGVNSPLSLGFTPELCRWLGGDSLLLSEYCGEEVVLVMLLPPRQGISSEQESLRATSHVRGVLSLRPMADGSRRELLDVSGRKVMDLKAGDNDVRRLAPGVYFVRGWGPGTRGEGSGLTKVIVAR